MVRQGPRVDDDDDDPVVPKRCLYGMWLERKCQAILISRTGIMSADNATVEDHLLRVLLALRTSFSVSNTFT